MANTRKLQDLVKGQYGRKIAYTYVDEITPDNIIEVLGKTVGIFYRNRQICRYLWDYYKGDQPIRYRRKKVRPDVVNNVVENHAYEIVQFKNGQTYGEPIQYISRKDDDNVNKSVDSLNDYMVDADKQSKDIQMGEWQSAVGTSFKAVQIRKNDEVPFRIVVPTPMNTYIVYSQNTEEPLMSVQDLKDANGEKYFLCFTANMQYIIKKSKIVSYSLHAYKDIPIVEYPNNHERLSDIELVIDLLDAINGMQSNRMDAVEQFVQSWIKFINCVVDTKQFQEMKEQGALLINSNNGENKADADIMTQELNQSESQIAKEDLWNNALSISAIPNKQGNTGGDTQGAVELRNGWDFSKTRAKLKDSLVKTSEKRFAKLVLNILRLNDKDLKITTRDFDVQINHSPTDNLIVKCQALEYLVKNGIHPLVAIKTVGLWGDAEKTYLLSKEYLDKMIYSVSDADNQLQKAEELKKQFEKNIEQ